MDELIYIPDADGYMPVRVRDITLFNERYWEISDTVVYDVLLETGVILTGEIRSQDGISARDQAKNILRYDAPIWKNFEYYGSQELRAGGVALKMVNLEKILSMDLDLGIVRFNIPPVSEFWPGELYLRGGEETWRIFEQWELLFRQKGFRVLKYGQGNLFRLVDLPSPSSRLQPGLSCSRRKDDSDE